MTDRKFRFGLVHGLSADLDEWTGLAKWAEEVGYDVLLTPDTPNVCSPFVALTAAATVTTTIRLGTFVLATPTRQPGLIAWDTASLDRVSGGRVELGLGAGRPDAEREAAVLGAEWGSAGRRVTQIADTITELRKLYADPPAPFFRPNSEHVPVMIAGAGAKLLGVAARQADIVAIGASGGAGEEVFADRVRMLREQAGERFDHLELSYNVWQTGDAQVPPWMAGAFGLDLSNATDNRVMGVLNGSPAEAADVLLRRRDELGISYITVNSITRTQFVPILERLHGR